MFYADGRIGKGLIPATKYLTKTMERRKDSFGLTLPLCDQPPWWGSHGRRYVRCGIASVRKQREAKVKAQLALSFLFGLEPQSVAAHSWHRWVGGSFPLS